MDEIKMWTIDGTQATPVSAAKMIESEGLLEEILVNNPDMLMPELTLVGRQTDTEGGPLDLLGVDSDGRLVLFELKRGRLSRDAVAQIIDYASDLEDRGVEGLAAYIAERSGAGGIEKIEDFADLHAEKAGADNLDALLPLRMFLVGLGVDDRTERMVNFLANKGVDISLLTFHGFEQADGKMTLARQMRVMADDAASSQPQPKKVSKAEWRERLAQRAAEGGVLDVYNDTLEMFRKEFDGPIESEGAKGTAMHLRLSGKTQSFARVNPEQGQVRILFYGKSTEPCREDFRPLLKEIRYETWPRDRQPLSDSQPPEIQFMVNTEEWETYKSKLRELTGAVYAAIRKAES